MAAYSDLFRRVTPEEAERLSRGKMHTFYIAFISFLPAVFWYWYLSKKRVELTAIKAEVRLLVRRPMIRFKESALCFPSLC